MKTLVTVLVIAGLVNALPDAVFASIGPAIAIAFVIGAIAAIVKLVK